MFLVSSSCVLNKNHQKQTAVLQSEIILSDLIQSTVGARFHHVPFCGVCPIGSLHGVEWETSCSLSLGGGRRLKRLITAVCGKEDNVLKISFYVQDSLHAAKRRKLHSGADSWIAVKTPVMMPCPCRFYQHLL